MDDTAAKTPAEAEEKQIQTPDIFREWRPLDSLFSDLERTIDPFRRHFWRSPIGRRVSELGPFWGSATGAMTPVVDIVEKDKHYEIKAELAGIDPSNVEVKISNGVLTIKGEKKEEKEEKKEDYYLSERSFGSFQRSFSVPAGCDENKIEANFSNGVLAITLPKSTEAIEQEKKIAIQTS